jgi:arabinogalactan endo-1,4-beta-galactosidase
MRPLCLLYLFMSVLMCGLGPVPDARERSAALRPSDLKPLVAYTGVDASDVPWLERAGVVFRDEQGGVIEPMSALAARGANLLRIRVFVDPADGRNGLDDMLELARRGSDAGMNLLIDLHLSDTWADPGQQRIPPAWAGLSAEDLAARVRAYTRSVVVALAQQGTPAAVVQIGNEITDGMLWPIGRVSLNGFEPLAELIQAGSAGVREGAKLTGTRVPKVMVHIDRGGDAQGAAWFYDGLLGAGGSFDVVGLSYYPWWHGGLSDLRDTITTVTDRYAKPVMVVETAYPWTLGWADQHHNIVGDPAQLIDGYDASDAGRRAFLEQVSATLVDAGDGLGMGWCAWGAAMIADPRTGGSAWENIALFDFEHRVMSLPDRP